METIYESKFEYKFVTRYEILEKIAEQNLLKHKTNYSDVLNELGRDGWELVSVLQYSENSTYIFKRAKWEEKKAQGQEEQADNSNKVDHKFKVGDWIVNQHGTVRHIEEVGNVGYQTDEEWLTHDCYEKDFHLWTIQDAREGDVLAVNNEVFIYAHRKQMYPIAVAHCFVDSDSGFYLDGEFGYINSIHPATKEQRELLWQKMKEAGYMWDSDSKQLLSLKAEPNNEKKFAWSEEDENILKNLTDYFMVDNCLQFKEGKVVKWHESLKDRVEPKNRWKPSNEQIKALRWVLNNIPYNKHKEEISGLLDQIKDL